MSDRVPALTIGLPVYNGERTIEQAIQSILASRFQDFVLVICDNASDDSTWEILKRWSAQDDRIIIFRHKSRVSASKNFEFVLNRANTEYFSWAACDDTWDDLWFLSLVEASSSNGAMAFGTLRQVTFLGDLAPHHPSDKATFDFSGDRMARRLRFALADLRLGKANLIYSVGPTKVFQKIDFTRFEGFAGDALAIMTILDFVPIVHVKGTYFYKRLPQPEDELVDTSSCIVRKVVRRAWSFTRPGIYFRSILPIMSVPERVVFLLRASCCWLPSRIAIVPRVFKRGPIL